MAGGSPDSHAPSPLVTVCEIARGGMGYVELVLRREGTFQRLYARKRLLPHYREDPAFQQMFLDEARLAGLARHPNVVSVLDVGKDEHGAFLLMDFVEGVPASRLLDWAERQGRGLPAQVAVRIALEAARGLHAAHEVVGADGTSLGLVHRDVSPQNILIGHDGSVRVTDFGIAKALGNVTRTATGILKGNMGYVAPEQLRFEEIDRRADLFSLGVVLYELLAGERLYANREGFDGPRRILHEPPSDIGEVRDDVPPELTELLFELLSKERAGRPATARDVAARLEAVLAALVEREGPQELGEFMHRHFGEAEREHKAWLAAELARLAERESRRSRRRRRSVLALGVAVALLAGVAAALQGRSARLPPPGERRDVWAGAWHSCALEGRALYCWGKGADGQLGDGTRFDRPTRWPIPNVVDPVSVSPGWVHGCHCTRDGRAFCTGRNADGQLGTGDLSPATSPRPVVGLSDCVQISAGTFHTCSVRKDGSVACWGRNDVGQLGQPPSPRIERATLVHGLTEVIQVEAGGDWAGGHFTCAVTKPGAVLCWGDNASGQLGDGTTVRRHEPAPVAGLSDAVEVAVGAHFGCARRRSGQVACWGKNLHGNLGDGTKEDRAAPIEVSGIADAAQIALGLEFACALRRDGEVLCWGRNDHGQLGTGTKRDSALPTKVGDRERFLSLAAGNCHACGRSTAGPLCWGCNEPGQIGDGMSEDRPSPVSVGGFRR